MRSNSQKCVSEPKYPTHNSRTAREMPPMHRPPDEQTAACSFAVVEQRAACRRRKVVPADDIQERCRHGRAGVTL